jgi:hypothetical protein
MLANSSMNARDAARDSAQGRAIAACSAPMGPFHAPQSKSSAWTNQQRKEVAPDFGVQVLMGANVRFWLSLSQTYPAGS